MPILPSETNDDNSPWYKIMEEKAEVWNEFAQNNGFNIEGNYNAYLVSFKAEHQSKNIKIEGNRQLRKTSSDVFPSDGVFQIVLKITSDKLINEERYHVKVTRSYFLNLFTSKLSRKVSFKDWYISYNDENTLFQLKLLKIFDSEKLRSLIIGENGIKITLLEFPSNMNILKPFLDYISKMK